MSQSWSLVTQRLSRTQKVSHTFHKAVKSYSTNSDQSLGARTTPSDVAFAEDGTRHVGDVAKRQVCKSRLIALQGTLLSRVGGSGLG